MPKTRRTIILISAFMSIAAGAVFLVSSHENCLQWYLNLNPHFYKSEHWKTEVFTPAFKATGNTTALLLMAATLLGAYCLWQMPAVRDTSPSNKSSHSISRTAGVYSLIALTGLVLAFAMHRQCAYANDEVFSAVHFAGLHPFQTVSQYPLPNNHLLFNLMNTVLSWLFDNPLMSGRMLSAVMYASGLMALYHFISRFKTGLFMKFAILAALALQFSFWGFSAQARGYQLVFLCSISALSSLTAYCFEGKTNAISGLTISLVAGMFCMPSFLYWGLGIGIAGILWMVQNKCPDRLFITAIIGSACTVLVLYGPLLLFTGLKAITDNPYTRSATGSVGTFIPVLLLQRPYFEGLLQEWTGLGASPAMQGIVLLIPALLVCLRGPKSQERRLMILMACLFAAFATCTLALRNLPFYRNLGPYGLFVLASFMLCVNSLIQNKAGRMMYIFLLLMYAGFQLYKYPEKVQSALYYHDVRAQYKDMAQAAKMLDKNHTIYLNEEAYYWWHVLQKAGFRPSQMHINTPLQKEDLRILPLDIQTSALSSGYTLKLSTQGFGIWEKTPTTAR